MNLKAIGKLAAMLLLGGTLAGCIDADVDVAVTSATTAKATMTQVMGAEFYSMVKMSAEQAPADAPTDDEFCADGALTENADGTATCVIVEMMPGGRPPAATAVRRARDVAIAPRTAATANTAGMPSATIRM